MSLSDLTRATVDGLIGRYAVEHKEFNLALDGGEVIRLKVPARYGELQSLRREATEWAMALPKASSDSARAHPLADVFPATEGEAVAAYLLHKLMVDPVCSIRDALALQRAPQLVQAILDAVDQNSNSVAAVAFHGEVMAEKKGSSETSPDASPLPSAVEPGASTLTN